jgi:predicted translin family RNA/ssDNA-binding protein
MVQGESMSTNAPPDRLALLTAEEILRTIYGDDLKGCAVSLDSIAEIVGYALKQTANQNAEWLELYDKVIEAVHLLSTPPDISKVTEPKELQSLLSQRLDAIRSVTTKTIETVAMVKAKRSGSAPGEAQS